MHRPFNKINDQVHVSFRSTYANSVLNRADLPSLFTLRSKIWKALSRDDLEDEERQAMELDHAWLDKNIKERSAVNVAAFDPEGEYITPHYSDCDWVLQPLTID